MIATAADTRLLIQDLPAVITALFARAHHPLLAEGEDRSELFIRYLRRKPGRGLTVIYMLDQRNSNPKTRTDDPQRTISLLLSEKALEGALIRFNAEQTKHAALEMLPSGDLEVPELGIVVQQFPEYISLPMLAVSGKAAEQSPLFAALQDAAREQLHDQAWQLKVLSAVPVRYKPASRCVIRYTLKLEHPETSTSKSLNIIGKVYIDIDLAQTVYELQQRLYEEQQQTTTQPMLPRPLGMLKNLGLTFNEAIEPDAEQRASMDPPWNTLRTGSKALHPELERGRGGIITHIKIPQEELQLTGLALARLHNSAITIESKPRTGAKEAKRARERATLIASRNPNHAETAQQLAQQLATRLENLHPDTYRPAHGGFKASQLLFHSHQLFVIDYDGFCLADPALDVGYFLAYLRPSGLWYSRAGMREWFEAAAETFRQAYRQAMLTHNVSEETITNIFDRSRLYEAALIFKIATRRVNRLNGPRPKELSAMLSEIAQCLDADVRRG